MRIYIEMGGGGDSDMASSRPYGKERSALVTVYTRSAWYHERWSCTSVPGHIRVGDGHGSTGNAKWGSWDLDMLLRYYGTV